MTYDDPLMIALLLLGVPALLVNLSAWLLGRWIAPPLQWQGHGPATPAGAPPGHGTAETRLSASTGWRAVVAVMIAGLGLALVRLNGGELPSWPALAVLAVLGWNALALWLWQLRFDSVGVSVPVLIFWRRARLWRQLDSVADDNPLFVTLHFADGAVMRVPKHIAGGDKLLHMAAYWITQDQAPAHARIARG
ncbi:hypothetical protein [Gemmobacter nectariphilus]|uniref:hypothetical protein n=1 Tax=Gemmobacter nectariphilus TaxID=220343 RepID=UPI00040D4F74|nr:hypothetical protein [Gemmobacter nectariphilus]